MPWRLTPLRYSHPLDKPHITDRFEVRLSKEEIIRRVRELMDALSGLERTMSVVLITHRPELLKLVDRVISIEDGVVVE